jgi:hypothetical protein
MIVPHDARNYEFEIVRIIFHRIGDEPSFQFQVLKLAQHRFVITMQHFDDDEEAKE